MNGYSLNENKAQTPPLLNNTPPQKQFQKSIKIKSINQKDLIVLAVQVLCVAYCSGNRMLLLFSQMKRQFQSSMHSQMCVAHTLHSTSLCQVTQCTPWQKKISHSHTQSTAQETPTVRTPEIQKKKLINFFFFFSGHPSIERVLFHPLRGVSGNWSMLPQTRGFSRGSFSLCSVWSKFDPHLAVTRGNRVQNGSKS